MTWEKRTFIKFGDVDVNPDQIAYAKTRMTYGGVNITLHMTDGRTLEMTYDEANAKQKLTELGIQ